MKIGIFISPRHRVPPDEDKILAPWYLVKDFADGLVLRKNDVYLFAAHSSETKATLYDFGIEAYPHDKNPLTQSDWEKIKSNDRLLFSKMMAKGKELSLEIYHLNQVEFIDEIIYSSSPENKYVFTLHDPITPERAKIIKALTQRKNCHFVSISNSQRNNLPFRFIDTVYNGTDLSHYPFQDVPSDYLLFMGRIRKEKGLHHAIAVSLRLNIPLEIGAPVLNIQASDEYFHKQIRPYLDNPLIGEPGFLNGKNKVLLYKQARMLLFPIEWEEPFGLVMIEAMACGTPVVAFARGSVPEVMVDGVTGFIVEPERVRPLSPLRSDPNNRWIIKKTGLEGLTEAVNKIYSMDEKEYREMRFACRRHVERKFTVGKMVEGYIKVYEKVLGVI